MLDDDSLTQLASLPVISPLNSNSEVFSTQQWRTLLSICDVFVPDLLAANTCDIASEAHYKSVIRILPESSEQELVKKYFSESIESSDDFRESIRQRFATFVSRAQSEGLAFLLSALDSRVGCLFMTGSSTPLHQQDLAIRTQVVYSWQQSALQPLRALYQIGEFLTKATWLAQSKTLHKLIDFPAVPKHIARSPGFEFRFLDFADHEDDTISIEADMVIVGSGCGAGVAALHLARSTQHLYPKPRILVVEKSYNLPTTHFPMDTASAGTHLFESGGSILSDDSSIAVLAGSTWGGGGTVNWSASLQPQHFVREEWSRQTQQPIFTSQQFQECLDQVCSEMGVCAQTDHESISKISHNFANKTLLEGARRLGLAGQVVPQNTAGKEHNCGRCSMGCASATKQGPANYWLPEAAKAECEFIQGCYVERVLWEESTSSEPKVTKGVRATWTSQDRKTTKKLHISCSRVIVSAGTLHSPLLLHRSGLTPEINPHIGRNLHLHPTLSTSCTYPRRVDPWDGSILTAAVTSLERLNGTHGPKLEIMVGTPDFMCTMMPHRPSLSLDALAQLPSNASPAQKTTAATLTALDYRTRLAHHGHSFGIIAIQRDHADASIAKHSYVYSLSDEPHIPRIRYTPSLADRECLLKGAVTAARIAFVTGAEVIDIFTPLILPWYRPSIYNKTGLNQSDSNHFEAWLEEIEAIGAKKLLDPRTTRLGSAHQMSTCRMSSRAEDGVVDSQGRVWGTSGLYVADASVLPSASGVNPMISTMAISLHIAKGIANAIEEEWKASEIIKESWIDVRPEKPKREICLDITAHSTM